MRYSHPANASDPDHPHPTCPLRYLSFLFHLILFLFVCVIQAASPNLGICSAITERGRREKRFMPGTDKQGAAPCNAGCGPARY